MNNNNLQIRKNLALTGRILADISFDDSTFAHISARSRAGDSFFIPSFGLLFGEMSEANLVNVDFDKNIITGYEPECNITGYNIHTPIYKSRGDVNAIFHLHTNAMIAVSIMKKGLLPISQHALHFYNQVAYHEYNSLVLDENVQASGLLRDLGDKNILFLRNHGVIICGKTIHECYFYAYQLQRACEIQVMCGVDEANLVTIPDEICVKTVKDLLSFEEDLGIRDWNAAVRKYLFKPSVV